MVCDGRTHIGMDQANLEKVECPHFFISLAGNGEEGVAAEGEELKSVEGKMEGRSVMDLKTPDRRTTPRVRVQFRTTFSDATRLEGMGIILDLSMGGCRIESPIPVVPGFSLELRIYAPDVEWPIMIEAASVQWVSGLMFGLAFFRLREAERQRLEQVINALREGESTTD